MLPKLNRKRALFVLTKIAGYWPGSEGLKPSGIPALWSWGGICAKCGRGSTGG